MIRYNTQQKAAWVQDTGIDCASQYLRFALIQSLQSRDVSTIQAAIIASQGLGLDVEIMSAKAVLRLLEEKQQDADRIEELVAACNVEIQHRKDLEGRIGRIETDLGMLLSDINTHPVTPRTTRSAYTTEKRIVKGNTQVNRELRLNALSHKDEYAQHNRKSDVIEQVTSVTVRQEANLDLLKHKTNRRGRKRQVS